MPPSSEQPRAVVVPASGMGRGAVAVGTRALSPAEVGADGVDGRGDAVSSHIRSAARGLDHSSIMAAELIAALLTWSGIGWLLDRWLGTGPWMLAIGALIGNAAGIYLIWLRSGRMEGFDGAPTRFTPRPGDAPTVDAARGPATLDATAAPSDGADER
jgi:F0F1-type ATP synthase assembly protein I